MDMLKKNIKKIKLRKSDLKIREITSGAGITEDEWDKLMNRFYNKKLYT